MTTDSGGMVEIPVKLLPLAEALSSLSAVQDDELPVSLRTDGVLVLMGTSCNQRSETDGDGGGKDGNTRIAPLLTDWWMEEFNEGPELGTADNTKQFELAELSSRLNENEFLIDKIDLRRRGL